MRYFRTDDIRIEVTDKWVEVKTADRSYFVLPDRAIVCDAHYSPVDDEFIFRGEDCGDDKTA